MPFKKGTSGNPLGRSVGSGNNELRNIINESIDPNKIREMLDKIENPVEYINAITKLLPYAIGKKKTIEDIEETEPISILINIDGQEI
jgi:tetrahydromethanopterin S-methyltransferase subunit G